MEQIQASQGSYRARFQRKNLEDQSDQLMILPGTAKWASSNPAVAEVTPSPDLDLEVIITPGAEPGLARITFEALLDGDVDETGQLPTIRASRVVELQPCPAESDGFIVFDTTEELASL